MTYKNEKCRAVHSIKDIHVKLAKTSRNKTILCVPEDRASQTLKNI